MHLPPRRAGLLLPLLLLASILIAPATYGAGERRKILDILEENRGGEERLPGLVRVLLGHAREEASYYSRYSHYRDKYAWYTSLANQYEKLIVAFQKYGELKKLERCFVKEHPKWLERTRTEERRLVKELESLLASVQRDRAALAKTKEATGRHREAVRKLAREAKDYLKGNRDKGRIKSLREKVLTFRGELPQAETFAGTPMGNPLIVYKELLQENVDRAMTSVDKAIVDAEKELADLLRGLDHPELRELYRRYEATTKLLAKHLDEIEARSRKLSDQRKRYEGSIQNRVPDLVLRRDITDAKRTTGEVAKEIGALHQDMKRSVVADALDLGWLAAYDASLGKLAAALAEMEKGSGLLLELEKNLRALEKEAPAKLEKVSDEVLKSGRLDKLKPAFEKLEAEMRKEDEARRKLVSQAKRHFEKARAFREREPFAKATDAIERARTRWMKEGQDLWKRVYALPAVKECLAGPDSERYRQVLSELGAKDLDGLEAQVKEIIRGSVRKLEREGVLEARDIETLMTQCKAARRLSSERKAELPRWVAEMERVLPRLKIGSASAAKVRSKVDEYLKAVADFVRHARKNYDTSLKALQNASSLEQLLSHRSKIEDWAGKHRDKLAGIQAMLRPIESDLAELGKLPRSGGGLLEPLIKAANGRANGWRKQLEDAGKTLQDPKVRSMLRGID